MSDTIRWCFTEGWGGQHAGCMIKSHNVVDALVIRADQDVYLLDEDAVSNLWDSEVAVLKEAGVLRRIGEDT